MKSGAKEIAAQASGAAEIAKSGRLWAGTQDSDAVSEPLEGGGRL